MDNQIINQQPIKEDIEKEFTHQELLSCLYFIFDAFERAGMEFFLVKDTAKWVKNEDQLRGDHLDIGVRRNTWQNDMKDILFEYLSEERIKQTENLSDRITFVWNDIPFTIHFYEESQYVSALVPIVYENEHWLIPNQFDRFQKEFDHD